MAKKKSVKLVDRAFRTISLEDPVEMNAFKTGGSTLVKQTQPTGSSGTEIMGGQFSEEYLPELQGQEAARKFDEMRRSETQIAMLLNAVTNPIKAANWSVEAFQPEIGSGEEFKKHAELVEHILFDALPNGWENFKHEVLTFIPFGFAIFEKIHSVNLSHPKFGNYNGLAALGWRNPKTIFSWKLEKKTGRLLEIEQQVTSDVGDNVKIPGEFLVVFSLGKEGDNYEGISALRPLYGAYTRKELYLKLIAIGLEKYAVGVPIGTIPKDKVNDKKQVENFINVLKGYASHEKSYITKPEGWEIEVQKAEFDASKITEVVKLENLEMVNAFVANFLALGTGGSGGSYSLGSDLSTFFLGIIQSYANVIANTLNATVVKELVEMNFGPQPGYPKITVTGINDKAGADFATVIKTLIDSKALTADALLEEFLRKQYKLPKHDAATARKQEPKPFSPFGASEIKASEAKSWKFAQTYKQKWNGDKRDLKALMQLELEKIWTEWQKRIKSTYNGLPDAQKSTLPSQVTEPSAAEYKAALRNYLAQVSLEAIDMARKEVPAAKDVKLVERLASKKFAIYDPFDRLPPTLKKFIKVQADLIADTQMGDLSKVTYFQYSSSEQSTDDVDLILKDLNEKVEPMIEGSTAAGMSLDAAAGNAVAQATQAGRNHLFFEPEVLDEIESFTFYNEDPVSEICQDLNGQTFAANDPEAERYFPPLHHNCKSRLVPNLKGDKNNPEITEGGLGPSSKDLEKLITLCESHNHYRLGGPGSGGAREGAGRPAGGEGKQAKPQKGKMMGSAPSLDKITEGIEKFYYANPGTIKLQPKDDGTWEVHNSKGKIDGVQVRQQGGRFRFEDLSRPE